MRNVYIIDKIVGKIKYQDRKNENSVKKDK